MPSSLRSRRFKPIFLFVVLFTLTILYITSGARQTTDSEFYRRTQERLLEKAGLAKHNDPTSGNSDATLPPTNEDDVAKRLKQTEEQAKARTDEKGDQLRAQLGMDELPDKVDMPIKPAPKVVPDVPAVKPKVVKTPVAEAPSRDQVPVQDGQDGLAAGPETKEEHKVEGELNSILKRSPIIIFSKSYCPYSAKAKRILLEQYRITPPPYVVELDKHELGQEIQDSLEGSTGRRTVPNVLINGKSIGGGDDVEDLHIKHQLVETIKSMGGKRIQEVIAVETPADSDDQENGDGDADDDKDDDNPDSKVEI